MVADFIGALEQQEKITQRNWHDMVILYFSNVDFANYEVDVKVYVRVMQVS